MNSAASLAAGLPVGRLAIRLFVVAAYGVPAVAAWLALGLLLGLPLRMLPALPPLAAPRPAVAALAAAAVYAGYYGVTELAGRRGLAPPGRRWQVPQTMMIGASPRRRVLVWGAILGPGFVTRNPYAGFGLLPIVVAAMIALPGGPAAGLRLAAAIGLAHGTARAAALLRDVRGPRADSAAAQLDLLLKTVYWRRLDGVALLAVACTALAIALPFLI